MGIPGFVLLTAALCVLGPPAFAAPPVEAFGRLPTIVQADLSPSGEQVVAVTNVKGEPVVAVLDLKGGAWRPVLNGRARQFRVEWCRFKTERRILCGFRGAYAPTAGTLVGTTRLVGVDADGRNARDLLRDPSSRGLLGPRNSSQYSDRIVSMLHDDRNGVLLHLDEEWDGLPSVVRVNIDTGAVVQQVGRFRPARQFFADAAGNVRAAFGMEANTINWFAREDATGAWRELDRHDAFAPDAVSFLAFGDKKHELYMARPHDGRDALWLVDLAGRGASRLLFAHPELDIDEPVIWNERLVGVTYHGERPEIHFLDDDAHALYADLRRRLPGTVPEVLDLSREGHRVLVRASADRQPPRYFLIDRARGTMRLLGSTYSGLEPVSFGAMNAIAFTARDRARVPGYLTLPPGAKPERLPLIVMPHDGPGGRDVWGFDYLQQFLVSRGYAVLQVEYRGSSGYGYEWSHAAHQDWGGVTYDDVVDGVRWAIERRVADPRRVAILGVGFGGYLSLLGAARSPELFRCAVSIGGISDLQRVVGYRFHFTNGRLVREQFGKDGQRLRSASPRHMAADVRVPVQLFHGADDVRVEVEQSRLMSAALRRAVKRHELIVFPRETHGIEHEENRIEMLRRIEAFLAAHLVTTEGKQ